MVEGERRRRDGETQGCTDKSRAQRRLGPVSRLMPTTAAITLKKDREPAVVLDGPFAETREGAAAQVFCPGLRDAGRSTQFARELGAVNPGGSYEIRPVGTFMANNTAG